MPEISGQRMGHIVHIQLSLNIQGEWRERQQIFNGRYFTDESVLIHGQNAILLDVNAQNIARLHIFVHEWHHSAYACLDKPDIFVELLCVRSGQLL